jgi:hypothetical protein
MRSAFIVAIALLSVMLVEPVYGDMPLTGKWIGDYLVNPSSVVQTREEAKITIHLGNMKLGGFAPPDLNITVEFLEPNSNVSLGRYEALSWANLPELYGLGPGYYKTPRAPVFDKPGIYNLRVRIEHQGEADFELKVVEQSGATPSLIENMIRAVVVGVIGGYVLFHLWRRRRGSAKPIMGSLRRLLCMMPLPSLLDASIILPLEASSYGTPINDETLQPASQSDIS